ncbi:hypothetical protein, partial [Nonomuraea lactucae]|uniref:hypothetical protein n=1 Tax=Nonomuraea lactucae TaxID=2249762 RepID=UPI00196358B6
MPGAGLFGDRRKGGALRMASDGSQARPVAPPVVEPLPGAAQVAGVGGAASLVQGAAHGVGAHGGGLAGTHG